MQKTDPLFNKWECLLLGMIMFQEWMEDFKKKKIEDKILNDKITEKQLKYERERDEEKKGNLFLMLIIIKYL